MRTTRTVHFLCYAGALPFLAGAVLIWFDEPVNPFFVLQAFNIYSLMILSFLCGAWWGFAFSGTAAEPSPVLLLGGTGLFLCLWLVMLFVPSRHILAVLGIAYFALLLPELRFRGLPVDNGYRRLRIILTAVAVLSHLSVFLNISGIITQY